MGRHEELQEEIPAYIASRLGPEERLRLDEHLAECDRCAEIVAVWKEITGALREPDEALRGSHPPELALRKLALGESPDPGGALARHLQSCPSCQLEVEVWRSREGTGRAAARSFAVAAAAWGRPVASHALAIAAGLLLGIGLIALLRPAPAPQEGRAPELGPGPLPLLLLRSPLRGEEAAAALEREAGVSHVLVAVQLELPDEGSADERWRFDIEREGGPTVWSAELAAAQVRRRLEASEVVIFPVPADALPPGSYWLRVRRAYPESAPALFEVPFAISGLAQRPSPAATQ